MTPNDLITTFLLPNIPGFHASKVSGPVWASSMLAVLTVTIIEIGVQRDAADPRVATAGQSIARIAEAVLGRTRSGGQLICSMACKSGLIDLELSSKPWLRPKVLSMPWQQLARSTGKACLLTVIVALLGMLYSQAAYTATTAAYRRGILKRYYPLPTDTNWIMNFNMLCSFTILPALWACLFSPSDWHWQMPPIQRIIVLNIVYMAMHDVWFYVSHTAFHTKLLYRIFHEQHHENQKELNVADLFVGELADGFLSIGLAWMFWVATIGRSGSAWSIVIPCSYNLFTNMMGHSGYKSHPFLLLLHPLNAIMVLIFRHQMLSPGDHQAHHVYWRVNYGMYFRAIDKYFGTYKRLDMPSHDYTWWRTELRRQLEENGKPYRTKRVLKEADFALPPMTPWGCVLDDSLHMRSR